MKHQRARLLVTGVAVLDFVFQLDALPQRPEKYRARDAAIVGGGCAANAAVAVARLGGEAMLASRLGADAVGGLIAADLVAEGVDCHLARRFGGFRSSISAVFVDGKGERQIVNFRDETLSFDATWLADALPEGCDAMLADSRWPQGAKVTMAAARARGIAGVMDAEAPVAEAADSLALASHIAFSAQGLRDHTGEGDLEEALFKAAARLDAWLCVTDGANDVIILDRGKIVRVPTFGVDTVDTLGAGDVWHGAFALRLAEEAGETEAVRFANAAAAIKSTRFGGRAGTPTRAETQAFLAARNA